MLNYMYLKYMDSDKYKAPVFLPWYPFHLSSHFKKTQQSEKVSPSHSGCSLFLSLEAWQVFKYAPLLAGNFLLML